MYLKQVTTPPKPDGETLQAYVDYFWQMLLNKILQRLCPSLNVEVCSSECCLLGATLHGVYDDKISKILNIHLYLWIVHHLFSIIY